jgi:glycosyltransferase involved in cell wall biosynthesis
MPTVGVFVQAYNTAAYVRESVASALGQAGPFDLDVLVIDDGSTDGTADRLADLRDPRLRIVRHGKNVGAIATANEGYAAVRGDLVLRLDSDDRLRPGMLARLVPELEEDARLGFVYSDVATIDAAGRTGQARGNVRRLGRPARGNELFPLLLENFVPAPATLARRVALASLLPVPSTFRFLDWYVTTGIAEHWDTLYVDEVLADYRVHPENMHRTMVLDRTGESTSRQILDRLFSSADRRAEKARWRRRVYASHYRTYAEKYFGCHMNGDARRCYWEAVRRQPALMLDVGLARRFAATVIGRGIYESVKGMGPGRRAA